MVIIDLEIFDKHHVDSLEKRLCTFYYVLYILQITENDGHGDRKGPRSFGPPAGRKKHHHDPEPAISSHEAANQAES